jgi:signal transduction histidine kinase
LCRGAGIDCLASIPEEALVLDSVGQLAVFRVAQDVLAGIIARGGAKNIEIEIEPHQDEGREGYLMTIADDGVALDGAAADALLIASYRVSLAGGHIETESRQGGGNQVRVFFPRSA